MSTIRASDTVIIPEGPSVSASLPAQSCLGAHLGADYDQTNEA